MRILKLMKKLKKKLSSGRIISEISMAYIYGKNLNRMYWFSQMHQAQAVQVM